MKYLLQFYVQLFFVMLCGTPQLILLDVDLEFRTDLSALFAQFKNFEPTEVIGCGVTQSPFYFEYFKFYRSREPDTNVGRPGRYQVCKTSRVTGSDC